MKELALINPRNVSNDEVLTYSLREAARAIVFDENNLVALLHVTRDGYYKLPGGGIDENETKLDALQRECQEEVGCRVEVLHEIGSTTEYWKEDTDKQISYCYMTKVTGPKGIPLLTESERKRGFETVWLPYEEAIAMVAGSKPTHFEGEYIVPRELVFLEEARKYLAR